jgi:transposase InsO family protein
MDQEKKEKVAVFRFGVIFPLVECNTRDHWGEKASILRDLVAKEWDIPYSDRNYISKATILGWLHRYQTGGRKIEALYPADRGDKGRRRKIDGETIDALMKLRSDLPKVSTPRLVEIAESKGLFPEGSEVSMATIYRLMKNHKREAGKKQEDMRKFEVQMTNDLWQSDCMHGPQVLVDGKLRKTYLFALIDDHSRLIPHGQFYLAENLDNYLDCLWTALRKRGLPRKLYVDNGPSFRAHRLQLGCASLEIGLSFARPYRPQGKGKIERFFRTVRSQFLAELPKELSLKDLNNHFETYLEQYHNRKHGTTGQAPIRRYLECTSLLRSAPGDLPKHFRKREVRKVNNDRTVKLDGQMFEAPAGLVGTQITLRFENYDNIEVYVDDVSKGYLKPLNQEVNSRIGRNSQDITPPTGGGKMFERMQGGL